MIDECETFQSPGGTKYWVLNPSEEVRISIGDEFSTIDEADVAYRRYADDVGFDVGQTNRKKNKEGFIQTRYMLCNRKGIPSPKEYDTLNLRPGQHKERHNHRMYNVHDKQFTRSRRQLKYTDYRNIYNAPASSFGGSKSHTIQFALKGGVEYIGESELDYKNARRDLVMHVGKRMHTCLLVCSLNAKKLFLIFFEYKTE
ncbi:hypothetical protein OSB04_027904 [Centaurea solstitialis]|uniref:FAR1 domain-containing protein n=1 Tax=Centaurea solstitialis TaxID=347529 RepID=A0AA38SM53_9ASTR|nr:hypothetical protein OSB04_027904 [Centaurea solstitialis]